MEQHKIVINAKLEFEIDAEHEVLALSQTLIWLCDTLTKEQKSPLKKMGFNLCDKE